MSQLVRQRVRGIWAADPQPWSQVLRDRVGHRLAPSRRISNQSGGWSLADVFVSYSRRDAEFVRRIARSLESFGKSVWIDTDDIADTEVFPQAIRNAIEGSDSFLFVITPSSVVSDFCEQEITYAKRLEKRMVPVLLSAVPDPEIPEEIRHRNWIPFTKEADYDASIERVVRALDNDLELRKLHTRLLVKAVEWDGRGRDGSLLLRGSELDSAENWLAGCGPDSDPSPTTLQSEYVLAGRRAATRRQRTLVMASVSVAVLALGLGAVALVSRNQAVASGKTDRVQALAAESADDASADPEVSVLLGREAVQILPNPVAVAALREATDASAVRQGFPTESGATCGFQGGPSIAYNPRGNVLAESLCTGELVMLDRANGHVIYRRHVSTHAGAVAYDPVRSVLAVGTTTGVDLLDPVTKATTTKLVSRGQPNALAFSSDGSMLAATTNRGTTVWDLPGGTVRYQFPGVNDNATLAFTSNGQSLVVGTGAGFSAVFDLADGQSTHELKPPANQRLSMGTPNPVAIGGNLLAVGADVSGPGDISGYIDLWNTNTWRMVKVLTSVTDTAIGAVAVSSDGRKVAVGNSDGTGGVWSVNPDEELVTLRGQTADIDSIAFSPDGTNVAAVAEDGTARTYRADGPWLKTLPTQLCDCGNEIGWQPRKLVAMARSGNDIQLQTWLLPEGRLEPGSPVISDDQQAEGAVISPNAKWAATWNEATATTTVQVTDAETGRMAFTLPATTVENVAFSNDGRFLVVADDNGGLHVADLSDHHIVVGHGWPSGTCENGGDPPAVSATDKLVAAYTFCGQVSVGKIDDARPFETFDQHQQISRIAFSPDGTRLALASWDSSVTVVNVLTDQPVLELIGHTRGVTGVTYAPTGGYIVTTSGDNTMRLWDASSGQLMQVDGDDTSVNDPSVNADATLAADENSNNQVRIWAVCPDCRDPSALLKSSRSAVVSPLTPLEREAAASGQP